MVAFNKDMISNQIKTWEQLKLLVDEILYVTCRDVPYQNDNGFLEPVMSSVPWAVQPPRAQNTNPVTIDYQITKSAIALATDYKLLPGKFWLYAQEIKTSNEVTIPSEWLV